MKYLYVLTSDETDYYYEQALLSMTSLRLQMPDAFISLLVDNTTEANLTGKRTKILELVNEYKPVAIDEKFSKMIRSRWLKTSMRQLITDDFLYIDGDTIIVEDLSIPDNLIPNIGAVLNIHQHISELMKYKRLSHIQQFKALYAKLGFLDFNLDTYYNSGVLFCKDCPTGHDFFKEWHRLWLYCFEKGVLTDQQSLNYTNFILGNVIKEIDGIWNCQISCDGALRYLYNSKIIHYFSYQPREKAFIMANKAFFNKIIETGIIDQNITEMLKNAKSAFLPNTRIMVVDRSVREFYDSALCGAAKRVYYSKFGNVIEFVFFTIRKYIVVPLRKILLKRRNK